MNRNTFIYGISDLADNLYYLLKKSGEEITGFIVDKAYKKSEFKEGLPIYEYEKLEDYFSKDTIDIYLCIGYSAMNKYRKEKFRDIKNKGYCLKNYIHETALVETEMLGEGNLIFEQAYIGMFVQIGDGNIVYPRVTIAHHSQIHSFNYFSIGASIAGHVTIGDENFFGNLSLTKDKISIGNRNLIGAGTYISDNVADDTVWVPQRSVCLPNKKGNDFL